MDVGSCVGNAWILVLVLCSCVHNAVSLECYECSSLQDSRCGDDWNFGESDDDAVKYKVQCPSQATACQKIVGEIQGTRKSHVYRKCWLRTTQEPYTPTGCQLDDIRGGAMCRCTGNLCNGQQRLGADVGIIVYAGMLTLCAVLIRM